MTLAHARWISIAVMAASTIGGGCASQLHSDRTPATSMAEPDLVQSTPDPIHIIYRTRSDRLSGGGSQLPPCCIVELRIVFPHAMGQAAMCQAQVIATPCTDEASVFPERGWRASLASAVSGSSSAASAVPAQTWAGDVPLWQAQAVVKSMEKANFFDKKRTVFSPDVFLSIETKDHAVGKRYRAVPELDAMLVRVVSGTAHDFAGPAAYQPPPVLARLPGIDR